MSSPSGVCGAALAEIEFGACILEKYDIWWQFYLFSRESTYRTKNSVTQEFETPLGGPLDFVYNNNSSNNNNRFV